MKLHFYTLLLAFTSLFLGTTLTSCNSSPSKSEKPAKKAVSKKKKLPASAYWASLKDNLDLSDKQINEIKSIKTKYDKKIKTLKKNKKWFGKANVKSRKSIQAAKTTELKKLLGKKYSKYRKFLTENLIKPIPKKGGNKKPKAKKKAQSKKTGTTKKK